MEPNFAGNRRIENDVVANVASYGRQLGILTEAVNELGGEDKSKAVQRLRELAEDIQKRKLRHKDDLQRRASWFPWCHGIATASANPLADRAS